MTIHNLGGSLECSDALEEQARVAELLNHRRKRLDFFPKTLFSEAGWDAILILFTDGPFASQGTEALASQLDIAPTTMARWIAVLEHEGLIERKPASSPSDEGTLRLSSAGRNAVRGYLEATESGF